ncbi:MAG: hypothetical protein EXR00_00620 [Alphaproteobacteria bacterium]|nr:hypothetical protein [Alphaproteobacteria bacterium]
MRWRLAKMVAACVVISALAGCNRNDTETATETAPAEEQAAQAPAAAAQAPTIAPGTELPVNTVSSAMLSRPADAPDALVIRVTGTALSAGWTGARLVAEPDNDEGKDVMTYRLVATSPKTGEQATTSPDVDIELRVDAFPPGIKTIRIVAATNEISLPVTN